MNSSRYRGGWSGFFVRLHRPHRPAGPVRAVPLNPAEPGHAPDVAAIAPVDKGDLSADPVSGSKTAIPGLTAARRQMASDWPTSPRFPGPARTAPTQSTPVDTYPVYSVKQGAHRLHQQPNIGTEGKGA